MSLQNEGFSIEGTYSIPFHNASGLIIVKAELEGVEGDFIFDTGANGLILNNYSRDIPATEFHTISGSLEANEVLLSRFVIGGFALEGIRAYSTDLSQVERHVGSKILGIIGAKMIKSELMLINIEKNQIEILTRKDFRKVKKNFASKLKVHFENDVPVINMPLGGSELNLVLDSGASLSLFDSSMGALFPDEFTKTDLEFELLTANEGTIDANYYYMNKSDLLNNNKVALVDLTQLKSQFDTRIDGIISFRDLKTDRLVIDFGRSELYLN